jgi:hypothetical protein
MSILKRPTEEFFLCIINLLLEIPRLFRFRIKRVKSFERFENPYIVTRLSFDDERTRTGFSGCEFQKI